MRAPALPPSSLATPSIIVIVVTSSPHISVCILVALYNKVANDKPALLLVATVVVELVVAVVAVVAVPVVAVVLNVDKASLHDGVASPLRPRRCSSRGSTSSWEIHSCES